MILTKVVVRMDSGMEFSSDYDKPEATEQNIKDIRLEIEKNCAEGSDFVLAEIGLLCISKIESIYIKSKEVDDE